MKIISIPFILLIVLCFNVSTAQTPLLDCGLTYFYDPAGNRILRMIVPCEPPSGKTSNPTAKSPESGDSTLATFQIVLIAPNPTAGTFKVMCNQDLDNANVSVLDMNGKVMSQTIVNGREVPLDISHLSPGSYIVVVTSKGAVTSKTVVKTTN